MNKATPYCKVLDIDADKRMLCDDVNLGRMYRDIQTTRGGLLSRSVEDSVVELASWLFPMMSKIPTVHGADERPRNYPEGWECFLVPKYRTLCYKIQQVIIPSVVAGLIKPSHREYMAAQRAKFGLAMRDNKMSPCRYWPWPSP